MRRVLLAVALSAVCAGCELEHPAPPLEVQAKTYFNAHCSENSGPTPEASWVLTLHARFSLDSHAARVAVLTPQQTTFRVSGALTLEAPLVELASSTGDLLVFSGASELWYFGPILFPTLSCPKEVWDSSVEANAVFLDKDLGTQTRLTFGPVRPAIFKDGDCQFRGQTSHPCGQCLARNCQDQINSCCYVASEAIHQCASSGACASLQEAEPDYYGYIPALQSCLKDCTTICESGTAPATRACQPTEDGCRCQASAQPNQVECSAESLGGVCCRDDEVDDCQCRVFGCTRLYEGCDCSIGRGAGELPECVPAQGERCCENGLHCSCGKRECVSGEREVSSCTLSQVSCPQGVLVSRCSP